MSDDSTIVDAHAGDDLSSPAGEWEADPTHSALEFVARYAMFTLVRARFPLFSGAVVIDPASPETTQIAVDIDASSVDSAMAWRDTHLRGEECFDIERHPSITFRLGVRRARRGALRGGGRLTIRGVTQPVRLVVDLFGRAPDVVGNPRLGFRATARLQRARWGITWNAPVLGGGVALADEVDVELDAQDRMTVLCPAVDLRRSRAARGDPQGVPRSVLAALPLRSRGR
jgi:polyisoprenoid-binding protein YceI